MTCSVLPRCIFNFRNSQVKPKVCEPWHLHSEKMKDIDIGKEYIIPSPGYRNVRERTSTSGQHRDREDSKYKRTRPVSISFPESLFLPACCTRPHLLFSCNALLKRSFVFVVGFRSLVRIYRCTWRMRVCFGLPPISRSEFSSLWLILPFGAFWKGFA